MVSAVQYGTELTSSVGPETPETANVRGVRTALNCFAVTPCHVRTLLFFSRKLQFRPPQFRLRPRSLRSSEGCSPRSVSGGRRYLCCVIAIGENMSVLGVKPFNGTVHSFMPVASQVEYAVLRLLELSWVLPLLSRGVAYSALLSTDHLDEPIPLYMATVEPLQIVVLCVSLGKDGRD